LSDSLTKLQPAQSKKYAYFTGCQIPVLIKAIGTEHILQKYLLDERMRGSQMKWEESSEIFTWDPEN
jgi:hypothetical protein